ncbi:MAG: Nif3-like dinuclear metal center hexameric protein [Nocardioidaceae bacterium]
MTGPATLSDVVASFQTAYPPRWADEGDAIGLVVGDPRASVGRVLFAVDPVSAVVEEAISYHADLLIVHHPLLRRAVTSVAADSPQRPGDPRADPTRDGSLRRSHQRGFTRPGVSESLALALGMSGLRPLVAHPADPLDKIVTFVPSEDAQRLVDALAATGAGSIGAYDRCAFLSAGQGTFRPSEQAHPTVGSPGQVETVSETRVEMVLPRARREAVLAALRTSHPYEEPAFDLLELAAWDTDRGSGRVGELAQPMPLRDFAHQVAEALPATPAGAKVSGDLDRLVRRVAVAGGAGDFLLDEARLHRRRRLRHVGPSSSPRLGVS